MDQQLILYPNLKPIRTITLQVTEDCCLRCSYCYQHNKSRNAMPFEVAKTFIDQLLNDKIQGFTRNDIGGVIFDFIGGEPLMQIDLITQIWEYALNQMIQKDHPWLLHCRGSICSNGILYFEPKVQKFFKKYHNMFSFTISIDGNKELHDKCRVDILGNGSYDRAIAAVHHFRQNYGEIETKMTLAPTNIEYAYEAIINLINEGYTDIFLNCVFEKGWEIKHARILYKEMKKISNYLLDNNLYDKIWISLFDEDMFCPMREEDNENWCGGVDNAMLAIDPQGNYFSCLRYMNSSLNGRQKPIIIGSIYDGYLKKEEHIQNNKLTKNITRRSQSTDECFYCPIANGCAWCSAFNYEEFGTPNKRATYICVMHKARALGNYYYWNKLYKKLGINKQFICHVSPIDRAEITLETRRK